MAEIPVRRHGHRALVGRAWELREVMTVYDAAYAALAEQLDAQLLTRDARMARAPGLRCEVRLIDG
jgi:predicted nucleic acid-binding protein